MKRTLDVTGSLAGLLLLGPLMLVLALGVLVSSGRPILFKQRRVGLKGSEFTLLKFRSMTVSKGAEQGSFDAGNTRRVTAFGRLLRSSKLDELPQLWNVLIGEMSLVGPRPEVKKWVQAYPDRWNRVLMLRPGITDPASIKFRHEAEILGCAADPEQEYIERILPEKIRLAKEYVQNSSLWLDFLIILKTIQAVGRRG